MFKSAILETKIDSDCQWVVWGDYEYDVDCVKDWETLVRNIVGYTDTYELLEFLINDNDAEKVLKYFELQ